MNKQEAIEIIKNIDTLNINDRVAGQQVDVVIKNQVLDIVSQIDEPQKPVVPKFVAEWIEDHKGYVSKWDEEARADFVFMAINDLFRLGEGIKPLDFTIDEKVSEWMTENTYKFITAILFDYTVEKEKLYTVEIPNPNIIENEHTVLLAKNVFGQIVIVRVFGDNRRTDKGYQLTEEEIKKDFEWAWQFAKEV